ncbi:hypothetical protein O6P43_023576 [Quillaja saponaria]|uniref:Uncharacterized protein n=1 Tax=Quillaja saponaria TaxID=32244 RepID=A0AAD7PJA0_QUISA|nr:hypothetical protein O6P43_023576 [Quillaja saponaria]
MFRTFLMWAQIRSHRVRVLHRHGVGTKRDKRDKNKIVSPHKVEENHPFIYIDRDKAFVRDNLKNTKRQFRVVSEEKVVSWAMLIQQL